MYVYMVRSLEKGPFLGGGTPCKRAAEIIRTPVRTTMNSENSPYTYVHTRT